MPPERGNCDTFNTAQKNVLFDNFTLFAPLIKKSCRVFLRPGPCFPRAFHSQRFLPAVRTTPRIRTKEVEASSFLRFAPIDLGKAQYASIHGANEHI